MGQQTMDKDSVTLILNKKQFLDLKLDLSQIICWVLVLLLLSILLDHYLHILSLKIYIYYLFLTLNTSVKGLHSFQKWFVNSPQTINIIHNISLTTVGSEIVYPDFIYFYLKDKHNLV